MRRDFSRRDRQPGPAPAVRHLRDRSDALIYGIGGVLLIAIALVLIVAYIVDGGATLELWLTLLAMLAFGVSGTAYGRAAVVVRTDSALFVVRNMYRSHEIRWSEVSGFERGTFLGPMASIYAVRIVVARLTDGRDVKCQGLHGTPDEVGRFLDEMNRELARRGGPVAAAAAAPVADG